MDRILQAGGFSNIQIFSTGGWHASLAQMVGLWVRRSPMQNSKRKMLSILLKPFISYLIRKDKAIRVDFSKGPMITGLYGICIK
jgi:hypothetical protein